MAQFILYSAETAQYLHLNKQATYTPCYYLFSAFAINKGESTFLYFLVWCDKWNEGGGDVNRSFGSKVSNFTAFL
jgi:hypothetical protein